ncbi:MAG: thioredoxin family protein [Chloroflexota bacterium]
MIERFIIVAVLALVGVIAYQIYTRRQLATISAGRNSDPILEGLQPDVPAIVYFTTPGCIPCKTQQQPALKTLRDTQEVQVIQIDATENPDAADRWGVMSAPTTFVLDSNFEAKAVNHGVAGLETLQKQLSSVVSVV